MAAKVPRTTDKKDRVLAIAEWPPSIFHTLKQYWVHSSNDPIRSMIPDAVFYFYSWLIIIAQCCLQCACVLTSWPNASTSLIIDGDGRGQERSSFKTTGTPYKILYFLNERRLSRLWLKISLCESLVQNPSAWGQSSSFVVSVGRGTSNKWLLWQRQGPLK